MNSPHRIALVSRPDVLNLREVTVGYSELLVSDDNPLGKTAVFKCKATSISEVFGYLLARLLQVPVACFQGLRFERPFRVRGYRARANHLGLLIEFVPNMLRVLLEKLAVRDKTLTAKFLTICFFDRHEWPQVFESGGSLYTLDLERVGPVMLTDEFEDTSEGRIRDNLLYREEEYVQTSHSALSEILSEADRLDVRDEVQLELSYISRMSGETLQRELSITDHPYATLLSAFFLSAVSKRQGTLSGEMGIQSWPQCDWESEIN